VHLFEDPFPPRDHAGQRQVAAALTIPIASGESHFTHHEFRDLILEGQIDVLQPDVVKAAGLTELQRIAVLASAFNRPMTIHNTQPTICTAAHLHFCAVHRHVPYLQEYNVEPVSIRDRWPILTTPLEVVDGEIAVPNGPGLGVEVDEPLVRRLAEMDDVEPGL
jgi:L-alanine-DL-glutamate epimerase-like enolase superfamily enzyme